MKHASRSTSMSLLALVALAGAQPAAALAQANSAAGQTPSTVAPRVRTVSNGGSGDGSSDFKIAPTTPNIPAPAAASGPAPTPAGALSLTPASDWTRFRRAPDARVIYVSSSTGNDANDGLTEASAKKTLASAWAQIRNGYPDWMLLKRGDTWNTPLPAGKSGRGATEQLVYGTYGNALQRPLLLTNNSIGFDLGGSRQHIALVGLEFRPSTYDGSNGSPTGIWGYGDFTNILIEDCKVTGYKDNISFQPDTRISSSARVRELVIRRSVIADAYSNRSHAQGIVVNGFDGLKIEENVIDANGYKTGVAPPTIFNHNVYTGTSGTNLVVRGNLISRPASHGVQARSGGTIEDNLIIRAPLAILAGGGDSPVAGGVTANVIDNVILMGTDIDPTLPRGFGIELKNIKTGMVARNIVADKAASNNNWAIGSYVSGGPAGVGVNNTTITDNVISNWAGNIGFGTFGPEYFVGTSVQRNRVVFDGARPNNYYVQFGGTGFPVMSENLYEGQRANNLKPFRRGGAQMNFETWSQTIADRGSQVTLTSLTSPFDLASYASSKGLGSSVEALITSAREQSRANWRTPLMARTINNDARTSYRMARR